MKRWCRYRYVPLRPTWLEGKDSASSVNYAVLRVHFRWDRSWFVVESRITELSVGVLHATIR